MPDKGKILLTVLFLLLFFSGAKAQSGQAPYQYILGALVRGDSSVKELALVFTGDEFADGGSYITKLLERQGVKGCFFLTGKFYSNPEFESIVDALAADGHYLGAHSDQHLLYCDWVNRDSLLVTREEFMVDLENNYIAMEAFGIESGDAPFFLPPYEWYNDSISAWTASMGLQLINFTHGTLSHADYTVPESPGYRSSQEIYESILEYENAHPSGLKGFILLSHIGTAPQRTDKFYLHLEKLILSLKAKGYRFQRIDDFLEGVL